MPKIPLPNSAAIKHTSAASPLTGGGLKLHYYGDNGLAKALGGAGAAVGRGLTQLSSKMIEFQKEYEDTENRLAAAEDRAFFNQSAEELRLKLADNPGASDEDKERWIAEFQQNYLHDRVQFTDRMTAKFRKGHDIEMLALQQSAANKQSLILIQSKVQRQVDEADSLYRTLCDRADFAGARQIIEENTGTLFNAETAARLLEQDLPMREQYHTASKLAEADPDKAVTMLEDQKNFDKLSTANRDRLIRFAKAKSAENTTKYLSGVIAQMNAGNFNTSSDDIKQQYETGAISQAQFNAVIPYVKKYEAQQLSSQNQAQQQELRLAQLRSEDKAGAFVYNTIYGADGSKRTYSETELAVKRLELFKLAGGNRSVLEKYLPKLNSALAPADAAGNPVTGNKKTPDFWKTPDGGIINKWITKVGEDDYAYRWDPDGWEDSENWSKERQTEHHLRMELQYRQLAEALYKKYGDTKDVIDTLIWARKQLNDGTISSFLQWRESNLPLIDKKLGYDRAPAKSNRPKAGDK